MEIKHKYSEEVEEKIKEIDSILEMLALKYREKALKLNSENIFDEFKIKEIQSEHMEEAKPYIELKQKIIGNSIGMQVLIPKYNN